MKQPSHESTKDMRQWLNEQGLIELMVSAVNGEVIDNQKLSLRQRTSLALKLSDKFLPDLKSSEVKKTAKIDVNIQYQATQDLISDVIDQ